MSSNNSADEDYMHGEHHKLLSERSYDSKPVNVQGDASYDGDESGGTGVIATFFNFVKASVGSGSFALPYAIYKAGLLFGSAGMILLGVVSVYTMQLMLECKNVVERLLPIKEKRGLNYTHIGEKALGLFGKWSVNLAVLLCNLGVCAGYMIFISSNLQWALTCFALSNNTDNTATYCTMNESTKLAEGDCGICFTSWELYAMVLPVLILLTFLPSFKLLAYSAYVGAIFLCVALVTVLVYGGSAEFAGVSHPQWLPESIEGLGVFFGITAFLFCVHSMVIPLESVMKKPSKMPYVLDAACIVVVGLNLPFAIYGYLLFGSDVQGYIFENLPGGTFNDIVRVFLSLELTLTFPIVFKPATEVAEEILQSLLMLIFKGRPSAVHVHHIYHSKKLHFIIARSVMIWTMRAIMVLLAWGFAVGVPRFELCLAIVGSFATSILAFVLPPLFHLALKWKMTHIARNVFHIILLAVGIGATLLATGVNVYLAIKPSSASTCASVQYGCVN